ncbi:MAG TPA: hypothetical protein VHE81_20760, partial [Lacipirellulaceae bacterium]|nr:hypothetical protein [Lacipirellulaceae bacterium]
MVKPLHPIGEIAARVSAVNDGGVRLTRSAMDRNGSTTHDNREDVSARLDAMAATVAALAEPIEFPPLAAGIVPGDRVAIAVDGAIPCVGEIVLGAKKSLEAAGVEPESISVVAS